MRGSLPFRICESQVDTLVAAPVLDAIRANLHAVRGLRRGLLKNARRDRVKDVSPVPEQQVSFPVGTEDRKPTTPAAGGGPGTEGLGETCRDVKLGLRQKLRQSLRERRNEKDSAPNLETVLPPTSLQLLSPPFSFLCPMTCAPTASRAPPFKLGSLSP